MDLTTITEQVDKIKEHTDILIKQYRDVSTRLTEAYNIAASTKHPLLQEIKTFIDNMDSRINNISTKYIESIKDIRKYITSSNENCKALDEDLLTISRDLMDILSTLR